MTGEASNNLNPLITRQGGTSTLPIRGITNEPAWVFVNGSYAPSKSDNSFEGKAAVAAGNNTVTATDTNGNNTANHYNVAGTGSGSKTLVYHQNGNLTSEARGRLSGMHSIE